MEAVRFPPWPYQEEALASIDARAAAGIKLPLIVMPTGTGKTVTFGHLLARRGGRGLVLVHRDELVEQTLDKLRAIAPDRPLGVVKAEQNETEAALIVASVQTLARPGRRAQLRPDFTTIVVDEAHHATAASYVAVLEYLGSFQPNGPLTTGWTATPERADGTGLSSVWQEIVFRRSLLWAITQGYLCGLTAKQIRLSMSLQGVRTQAGDYAPGALEERLSAAHAPNKAVDAYQTYGEGRLAVAFAVSVAHAEQIAQIARAAGIAAAAISGETPLDERRGILRDLAAGRLRLVANCNVLTEGFDCPPIDCLILARPTKSRPLYVQMLGRGLRTHPGKENLLVLDLVGSAQDLDCITAADLLGAERREAEREERRKRQQSGSETLPEQAGELSAETVNLFTRRRLHWVRVHGVWVLNVGAGQGMLALREQAGEGDEWELVELGKGSPRPLAQQLTLAYAQGYAETIAKERGAGSLNAADAEWRDRPMSEPQARWLSQEGLYQPGLTRGQAADRQTARIAGQLLRPSRLSAFATQ